MKPKRFKLGERTDEVWAGDLVTDCEFIADVGQGRMVFYDRGYRCFRLAFWETDGEGWVRLNGWACNPSLSGLFEQQNVKTS